MAKAVDDVIVHHSDRLHVRVDDGRADERETAILQIAAERVGNRGSRGDLLDRAKAVHDRPPFDEPPLVGVEAAELLLHFQKRTGVFDRRLDLHPVAHDSRVLEQRGDLFAIVARDLFRAEPVESFAVRVAFAQDRDPGEPGLRALEDKKLVQRAIVVDRHSPLGVVVTDVERVLGGPSAARFFEGGHPGTPL
jgi:hypothetical protein